MAVKIIEDWSESKPEIKAANIPINQEKLTWHMENGQLVQKNSRGEYIKTIHRQEQLTETDSTFFEIQIKSDFNLE